MNELFWDDTKAKQYAVDQTNKSVLNKTKKEFMRNHPCWRDVYLVWETDSSLSSLLCARRQHHRRQSIAQWLSCLRLAMHFTTMTQVSRFMCKHWTKGKVQDVLDHCHCIPFAWWFSCHHILKLQIYCIWHNTDDCTGCTLNDICKNCTQVALTKHLLLNSVAIFRSQCKVYIRFCCCTFSFTNSEWSHCIHI